MLTKPKNGWVDIYINASDYYIDTVSYTTDVALDLVRGFISYFSTGKFNVEFDGETYNTGLLTFNDRLYYISDQACPINNIWGIEVTNKDCGLREYVSLYDEMTCLAQELVDDILKNIDDWGWWNALTISEKEYHKHILLDQIADLRIFL